MLFRNGVDFLARGRLDVKIILVLPLSEKDRLGYALSEKPRLHRRLVEAVRRKTLRLVVDEIRCLETRERAEENTYVYGYEANRKDFRKNLKKMIVYLESFTKSSGL